MLLLNTIQHLCSCSVAYMAANHVCILTNQAFGTQEDSYCHVAPMFGTEIPNVSKCHEPAIQASVSHYKTPGFHQDESIWVLLHVASCCFILLPAEHREMYGDVWRCIECITAETWMPVSPAAQSKGEELTVKSPLVSLCPTLLALATKKPRDSMDMFNIQPNSTEFNRNQQIPRSKVLRSLTLALSQ